MAVDTKNWLIDNWSTLVFFGLVVGVVLINRQFRREIESNDRNAPPEDRQIRWHIRHIRQDLALIVYLLGAILLVLMVIAFRLSART